MKRILLWATVLIFSTHCFAKSDVTKLIFDNDAGNDDVTALIYLAKKPNISIEAITIAGTGETHGPQGAKNIADVCFLLGKTKIPIAIGSAQSYEGLGHKFPTFLRKAMDNLLVHKNIPSNPHPRIYPSAVELIHQVVQKNQHVTILATGPLTNIAEFIEKYPRLKHKIHNIVFMGGAVYVEGNIQKLDPQSKNTVAEWNIYADPKAAEIVFSSKIPITLVALDATNQVPMTRKFYESLSLQSKPEAKLVYEFLKDTSDTLGFEFFLREFYLWDTLAAMICVDPSLAITKNIPISVDVKMAQTKPATEKEKGATNINVVTHLPNANGILDQLFDELKK